MTMEQGAAAVPAAGNVVGIDPHKRTLSASVLDERGGGLGHAHFPVSGEGHRALEEWAGGFGPVARWGIEGAAGLGRHTAVSLAVGRGQDVRDVCPTRTAERARARRQGRSDRLDAERIARETLACPDLPRAFKRVAGDAGPDQTQELIRLWHNARRSLLKSRQHLLNECEDLLRALPEQLRARLPDTRAVRPRLAALGRLRPRGLEPATGLRLRLLAAHRAQIGALDRREREATGELERLVSAAGSSLGDLCGLAARSVAELLIEVGDPRRFSAGGFAHFNGTAPLPASSGEGGGPPRRHRLNRGGNRRLNAVLHRMAVTQLRCEPRAQRISADARRRGHTTREAIRIVTRHLSNVVWRRMILDLGAAPNGAQPS
jgi:transposase